MPLPSPQKDQTQDEFVSACMANETVMKDYPQQKQRLAVCFSQYERAKKKKASASDHVIDFDEQHDAGAFYILY